MQAKPNNSFHETFVISRRTPIFAPSFSKKAGNNTSKAMTTNSNMDKQQHYESFLPTLKALIEGVGEEVSVMANVAAALHDEFRWFWTGFYRVKDHQLILGPFQGPVACYTIPFGRGVCGTAWEQQATVVVRDVHEFPGHIACSSLSRSEIVVPVKDAEGRVRAVLDIDSKEVGTFDAIDQEYLEKAMLLMAAELY